VERPAAVSAVALNTAAGSIVHAVSLMVALVLLGETGVGQVRRLPAGWPALIAVVVVMGLLGLILWSPLGRRRVVAPVIEAVRNLVGVLRRPERAVKLFGGTAGVTAAYVLTLAVSLQAFEANAPLLEVVAVYLGAMAVGSISPTPAGLGAVEAALVAGLTVVGVETGPAVAGVLLFRLLTFWLPILPGFLAFRYLQRRQVL
jgi:undecaprenyl-diphosphatase